MSFSGERLAKMTCFWRYGQKPILLVFLILLLAACADGLFPETVITPTRASVAVAPGSTPVPIPTAGGSQTEQPTPAVIEPANELVVYFLDVGQGDATLLAGYDFTILIDAGRHDRSDVVPYLKAIGVESIDLLVGTHPHADHIGQFPAVLETFPVTEVWMSGDSHNTRTFERVIDAILAADTAYHEPRAGEVYQIGSARVEVVNPTRLTGNLHEGSLSLRIVFNSIAFLFTGDAEAPTEAAMVARNHNLSAQILQLGHHGSRTSSSLRFLQAVNPEIVIYSAGRDNPYGHPHPEVIQQLKGLDIAIYGTDVNGIIRVITDGLTYRVEITNGQAVWEPPTGRVQPAPEPAIEPMATAATTGCEMDQVNVNTASREELVQIIHIGGHRAGQILQMRPFNSVDDLTRVNGIGPSRLQDIKNQGLVCVE
jgi:competence protein ComEC